MKQIKKASLSNVLKTWSEKFRVLAPQKKESGDALLDIFDEATLTLDYGKPALPPKRALLPQSDIIFRVEGGEYNPNITRDATLVFGIRPCDMKGLLQSRNFMSKDFTDVYYEARAKDLATVVMACPGRQSETCFCTTTGSGPWADQGFDLQLFDMGDHFLVEAGSERGAELAALDDFEEVKEGAARKKLNSWRERAQADIAVVPEIREAMDRLKADSVPEELWDRFGAKCITCGSCSFVCPTCTCFNVYDRVIGDGQGERLRTWDACLFGGFTKEASGHNPRRTPGLRLKRRHEHKLLYYRDRDTFGAVSTCVGCGRCSDTCPVHIGALEVARAIAQKPEAMPVNPILEESHACKK